MTTIRHFYFILKDKLKSILINKKIEIFFLRDYHLEQDYIMEKFQEYLVLAGLEEKEHQRKGIQWLLSKEKEGSIFEKKKNIWRISC